MSIKVTIEGDDKDELLEAAKNLVEMLGGEESGDDDDDNSGDGDDDDNSGGDDDGDGDGDGDDDNEELLNKVRKQIAKLVKTSDGPDKVKAALAKFKAKKLDQVKSDKIPALAKLLKVKV